MITLIMLSPTTQFFIIIVIAILAGIGVSAVHALTCSSSRRGGSGRIGHRSTP